MKDFSFKIPQNIEFGIGSLKKLPEILRKSESNETFLISDKGLESIGLVDIVKEIIENNGIKCTVFLDVIPNPTIDVVNKATKNYEDCKATSIVALGGGSPLDVAKAVGVLATYGGDIRDYEGMNKVPGPITPIIAIPTTAGTGSEATASSVITDVKRNYKFSMISYETLPKYAILDPELIMTAPATIASSCGIDALIHAIEAYLSKNASPFSDAMAEKAMELIGGNIRKFVKDRKNIDAASAMMIGSNFAGISFAMAKLGNVHALSHPVSAFYNVSHGIANSILLPVIMEFNSFVDNGRYEIIYKYISENKKNASNFNPQMLIEELKKLNNDLLIPKSLSEVGVKEDMILEMANDAIKSGNILVNPRETTLNDVIELYKKAL